MNFVDAMCLLSILAKASTLVGCAVQDAGYRYVERLDRHVELIQGEYVFLGTLDRRGTFHAASRRSRRSGGSARVASELINAARGEVEVVYEFRSEALIPGRLQNDGRFVPDSGSSIRAFKDFKYIPGGTRIYNLPGYFVPVKADDKVRRHQRKDSGDTQVVTQVLQYVLVAIQPPDDASKPDKTAAFVFVEDTSREVAVYLGDFVLLGKLDKHGELQLESKNLKNSTSLPEWRKIAINPPTPAGKKVYEFRSGRLIRGEIKDDGSFVPDIGSKVTEFKDYKYTTDAIPIYNLPGRFVEADKVPKK